MFEFTVKNPPGFEVDVEALRAFEEGLDPRYPEKGAIPARVLGYGEISTVFSIETDGLSGLALKRLPIFYTEEELHKYLALHDQYNELLGEAGLCVIPHGYAAFVTDQGRPIAYLIQHRRPAESIGHRAIHLLSPDEVPVLLHSLLKEMSKLWRFNQRQNGIHAAIDAQFSNWAVDDFDPKNPSVPSEPTLRYLDTSTPLFRIDGIEQLNAELFLRAAPSFMRWVLRVLFLKDVLTRYYDFRLTLIDMIANFYREQHPDLIPGLVQAANEFLATDAAPPGVRPITEKEVSDYYREDKIIWATYLWMRRVDRSLHLKLLRREYPYILPEITKR